MLSKLISALLFAALVLSGAEANAHQFELGITLEPTFTGLPAVADDESIPTLGLGAGGGLGIEFMPTKYLALVTHFTYVHPVAQSRDWSGNLRFEPRRLLLLASRRSWPPRSAHRNTFLVATCAVLRRSVRRRRFAHSGQATARG